MPLQADAMICSGFRGSRSTTKTSESSIIPSFINCQLFPASVDLKGRHHVPAYIVVVFRGSMASESTLAGIVGDSTFSQSAPEFFDIHTPFVVPTRMMSGSFSDCVIE